MFTTKEYQFLREMLNNESKDNFIFAGFVRKKNNMEARKDIPITKKKLREPEYWQLLHKSQYILSPDGDRPECHRHYEAIGMGTMPITSLDPHLHRHLKGNVVFGEKLWNVTELESRLPLNPVVNRRLIFQEYWMEYIEREVGRPMRWWDPSRYGVRCSLEEIANIVKNST
jgi:hypothetical protein